MTQNTDNRIFKIISALFVIIIASFVVLFLKPHPAAAPQSQTSHVPLAQTTIFFAGDIMLSRNVANKMQIANDFTLPFQNVKDFISHADIAFANLESPFSNLGPYFIEGSLVFNANPLSIEGLKLAGFDILSTANNHTLDQKLIGLDFTLNHLRENGIQSVGTLPSNLQVEPVTITHENMTYGFLAYSYTAYNDGGSVHPRVANFNDIEKLKQDVLDLKGRRADIVIVSMHAGTEYTRTPSQKQIDFAHTAIDAGADLVIGHHPHWVQTVEQYNGKWIFYSLGNFVFDQMWSQDTKEGLTLLVTYKNSEITKIELKPVIIENYCCPRWANEEETKTILGRLGLTEPILMNKN